MISLFQTGQAPREFVSFCSKAPLRQQSYFYQSYLRWVLQFQIILKEVMPEVRMFISKQLPEKLPDAQLNIKISLTNDLGP